MCLRPEFAVKYHVVEWLLVFEWIRRVNVQESASNLTRQTREDAHIK